MMVENPTHQCSAKAYRQCLWLSVIAITFTLLWCIWWGVQIYFTFDSPSVIVWQPEMRTVQILILALYSILPWLLLVVTIIFSVKMLDGLKNGVMFAPACVSWLIVWGVLFGITDFVQNNAGMWGVKGEFSVLTLSPSCFVVPVFVFIFAALFRLAAKVSEDSNLAI